MEQSTYANSPPKAPAQKAQQGVSVRKCNRSHQSEKKPEKKQKIVHTFANESSYKLTTSFKLYNFSV